MTRKRKPIKVRYGGVKILADSCRVSERTVTDALKWEGDTDAQNLIRKRAYDLGLIKRF